MEKLFKHTNAYKTLELYASRGELRHAYLLLFPDPAYLRNALKIFAPLFFENDFPSSADRERVSSLIQKEAFADCLFFPEEGKKFTVEKAETAEEECFLRPVEGKTKLFVIGDFSDSTKEAQNKMLKMLEEPPDGVSFLLGATNRFSVLSTVLSRVEKIEIPPFSDDEISNFLLRTVSSLSADDAALCAKASGGIPGKAVELVSGGYFRLITQAARSLCFCSSASLPYLVREYGATKYPKELLSALGNLFFDALKRKIAEERGEISNFNSSNDNESVKRLASLYEKGKLLKVLNFISAAEKQLFFNGSFPQILEILVGKMIAGRKQI